VGVIQTEGQVAERGVTFWHCTFQESVYLELFMNDERLNSKPRTQTLDQRLASDPWMYERIHLIADMRDELIAQGCSMDEVESRVVEQIRLLGQELLGGIAREKSNRSTEVALKKNPSANRDSKKK
jgi:hypothetical protein